MTYDDGDDDDEARSLRLQNLTFFCKMDIEIFRRQ